MCVCPVTSCLTAIVGHHVVAGNLANGRSLEAMLLLRGLTEHATQREFVCSHKRRVGDLVVWDNRSTMHHTRRYHDEKYPRDPRRTTLTDRRADGRAAGRGGF